MPRKSVSTLITQLGRAKVELDAAKERYEKLAAEAREALGMGNHKNANVTVKVQPNRVWNKEKARENFGDDVCTMQVDLTKARAFLTGEEFESLYVDGAPKIIVQVGK